MLKHSVINPSALKSQHCLACRCYIIRTLRSTVHIKSLLVLRSADEDRCLAVMRNQRHRQLSVALSVLTLTLKLTSQATSGIPIVKQILTIAVRIAELAEKAERNAEELSQLASMSGELAQTVHQILEGRELNDHLKVPLDRLLEVLVSIENFMENHFERGTFKRALIYMFTASKTIEGFKVDLKEAEQQFYVAAAVDTHLNITRIMSLVEESCLMR